MKLHDVIGRELAEQLTLSQREYVQQAADEAPAGLRQVAAEIHAAGAKIERPVAVLLSRIKRGQHLDREPGANAPARIPSDHRDLARRLYDAKLADVAKHDTGWTIDEQRQHAIDYALDYCKASGKELWAIETELRRQHAIHLDGSERDFERDTDHRRLMAATHGKRRALIEEPTP